MSRVVGPADLRVFGRYDYIGYVWLCKFWAWWKTPGGPNTNQNGEHVTRLTGPMIDKPMQTLGIPFSAFTASITAKAWHGPRKMRWCELRKKAVCRTSLEAICQRMQQKSKWCKWCKLLITFISLMSTDHRSRHQFTKNLHRSATASIMTCFFVNSSKKSNIVTVPLGAPTLLMLRRTRGIVDVWHHSLEHQPGEAASFALQGICRGRPL